jgi:hypothetical protein
MNQREKFLAIILVAVALLACKMYGDFKRHSEIYEQARQSAEVLRYMRGEQPVPVRIVP